MNTKKYLYYAGVFAVGIVLVLNYMKFITYYKELSSTDDNLIYVYTDSGLPGGLVEECHKYQIDCELWNIEKEENLCEEELTHTAEGYVICAENGILKELYLNGGGLSCVISSELAYVLFGTEDVIGKKIEYRGKRYNIKRLIQDKMPLVFLNEEGTQLENKDESDENRIEDENKDELDENHKKSRESNMSIAMVRGMEALNYREIENLFSDCDYIIDVNLLKWIVYIITFFCFFCIMAFCLCQNKKWRNKKWFCFAVVLVWILLLKIYIYSDIVDFPVRSLPGKWSDIEGWGKLGEEILNQISSIIHVKEYPMICKYYEGVRKSIFYSFLSLILVYLFFRSLSGIRHVWAVHTALTIMAFVIYIYCSDQDTKMLIYFLPCLCVALSD